ncbi:MAG TPA: hypothetical protein VE197_17400 [Mycobacterium sp.]|nr:hypothetical protein [Mycobacterium sp.]
MTLTGGVPGCALEALEEWPCRFIIVVGIRLTGGGESHGWS